MAQEVGLADVYAGIEHAFKDKNFQKVEALLWPAVDQFPADSRLWFYGGCLNFKIDRHALAAQCFHRAIDLDDAPHIYSNLGACYRRMNMHERGLNILMAALERNPDYAPALVNVGSMYVNEGQPEKGIPFLERAVAVGGERGAVWNLGLLYLEAARFAEGFDAYREGVHHERAVRCYGTTEGAEGVEPIAEPKLLTTADVAEARANGRRPRLVVWGEQGIGDELMFGTILEEAQREFDVTFECHPRLQRLHHNAHPGLKLYPTRKDEFIQWPILEREVFEFKAPIGDLASYYRRSVESFNPHPTYVASPSETARYREQLEIIAEGRPIVAIATRGGVLSTAREYRTIRIPELDRLIDATDCLFVCVDYDDMFGTTGYLTEKHGANRWKWWPSIVQHWDYDHTAALLNACDLTVTVCQTVAHMSAGMGLPTRVLTPIRCAWRYATIKDKPDLWYWYPFPEVKLYRQDDPESWAHPIDRVIADIKSLSPPRVAHVVSPAPAMSAMKAGRRR